LIISHKYKFIFVKTHKTAGTSIEVYLSDYCSPQDILTPFGRNETGHKPRNYKDHFNPFNELLNNWGISRFRTFRQFKNKMKFYNHIPAFLIKSRIGRDIWNDYFKFCVERNPWDKTLSHYHFRKGRFGDDISFDSYLDQGKNCLNFPKYTDFNNRNKIIVDRVLRYETLNEELTDVFGSLGIPFNGTLDIHAKSGYKKDRRSYREILTKEQSEKISAIYKKEIEMHNYTF